MKRNLDFEVNPLDINIVKIQLALVNELKECDSKAFRFEHRFESKDPTLNLSYIDIFCYFDSEREAPQQFILEITAYSKNRDKKAYETVGFESFEDFCSAIDDKSFLRECKKVVFHI